MRRLFPVTETEPGRTDRRECGETGRTGHGTTERSAPGETHAHEDRATHAGDADPARQADGTWSLDRLADAYAYPEPAPAPGSGTRPGTGPGAGAGPQFGDRPTTVPPASATRPVWLRANMVSSLDGAGQHDGRTEMLSSATDMRVFGVLRALADVVVVGAQTVRQEGYGPARPRPHFADRRAAAGQHPAPPIAVVTASLDLDFSEPLFTEPVVPTILITGAEAPVDRVAAARRAGAEVVVAGEGAGVEPRQVVGVLAERGFSRLLLEGGPRLLGQFVAAGAVDELCLTLSPLLTAGQAQRIAEGPVAEVPDRFRLASLLEEDGFLFTRYQRVDSLAEEAAQD